MRLSQKGLDGRPNDQQNLDSSASAADVAEGGSRNTSQTTESDVTCSECRQTSPQILERDTHLETMHTRDRRGSWECNAAGCSAGVKTWAAESGLRKHNEMWHARSQNSKSEDDNGPHNNNTHPASIPKRPQPGSIAYGSGVPRNQTRQSPTSWTDWEWNDQYQCYTRYRLGTTGAYEYDYEYGRPHSMENEIPRSIISPYDSLPTSGQLEDPKPYRYDAVAGITEDLRSTDLNYSAHEKESRVASYYPSTTEDSKAKSTSVTLIMERDPTTNVETLDRRFKVHRSSEFKFGRVFKVLWSEPTGSGGTQITERLSAKLGGTEVYHKIRRFLIVDPKHGHSICVPILTYGGKGTSKPGTHPEDHAIIYTSRQPVPLAQERITRPAIRVDPVDPSQKLDPASRINYAKVYTVEHNVKVWFIGQVVRKFEQKVVSAYNDIHRPIPDRVYDGQDHGNEELFKFAEGTDPAYPAQVNASLADSKSRSLISTNSGGAAVRPASRAKSFPQSSRQDPTQYNTQSSQASYGGGYQVSYASDDPSSVSQSSMHLYEQESQIPQNLSHRKSLHHPRSTSYSSTTETQRSPYSGSYAQTPRHNNAAPSAYSNPNAAYEAVNLVSGSSYYDPVASLPSTYTTRPKAGYDDEELYAV